VVDDVVEDEVWEDLVWEDEVVEEALVVLLEVGPVELMVNVGE